MNVPRREHAPGREAPEHRVVFGQVRDHFRSHAQRRGRAGARDFARAVDAEQRGVLARHPQHITLAVRVDAVVAIGEAAAERGHGQRTVPQFGDELDQILFVHNIAFLSLKLAAGKPPALAR